MYFIIINTSDNVVTSKEEQGEGVPSYSKSISINVTKDEYDDIEIGSIYVDGKYIIPDNLIPQRITTLKKRLRDTDWIIIEILEYRLMQKESPHDGSNIHNLRQKTRDEIRDLSSRLL